MIVRMGLLRKRADLTQAQFRRHWIDVHGPIAARLPGLRKYHQNHVVDTHQTATDLPAGSDAIDGFSELWFENIEAMDLAIRSDACRPLAADEPNLIDGIRLIVAEQNVVMSARTDAPLMKRMSLIKRKPEISADCFRQVWFGAQAELMSKLPGLRGMTQNLIVQRWLQRGMPAGYDDVPFDGIAELWFKDMTEAKEAFATESGKCAMEQMQRDIAEVVEFGVEVHEVV